MEDLKFNYYSELVSGFIGKVSVNSIITEHGITLPEMKFDSEQALNIAFVGQYNAGKSSLIKALTGNVDIKIGSGVTTDEVGKYHYKGLVIWDTPGILAGKREQHDQASFAAMDEADLLIYVITNELFDDVVGAAFRDLCFAKARDKEILLVINKSQSDSGLQETKLNSIAEVLEPKIPEDFPIVFVDAESYFDALEESDIDDKQELMELSNIEGFISAIDSFCQDRGLLGKVTTPLGILHTQLSDLLGKLAAEDPMQDALVELLQQKMRILKNSQKQLQEDFDAHLGVMEGDIIHIGDLVAEAIDDGLSEEDFKLIQQKSIDNVTKKTAATQSQIYNSVDEALSRLESDLDELDASPLAESLKTALSDHFQAADKITESPDFDISHQNIGDQYKASVKTQQTLKSAEKGFSWLSNQAINKTAKEGVKAASGSNLHKAVLEVGHFFGTKFKPHQAVKIADKIGSAAKFIGPVMALIGVIVQINDDYQQDKRTNDLIAARRDVRKSYRDVYVDLKKEFTNKMIELSDNCYKSELDRVSAALLDIQTSSKNNIEQRQEVETVLSELNSLREKLALDH